MKIYNKSAFITGVICAGSIPLLLLGVIPSGFIQWALSLVITSRYLYIGLSPDASRDYETVSSRYKETAIALYGRHYYWKTGLPLFLLAGFFLPALVLRYGFEIYTPAWLAVLFNIALTISVFYSIGLNRKIRETIRQNNN